MGILEGKMDSLIFHLPCKHPESPRKTYENLLKMRGLRKWLADWLFPALIDPWHLYLQVRTFFMVMAVFLANKLDLTGDLRDSLAFMAYIHFSFSIPKIFSLLLNRVVNKRLRKRITPMKVDTKLTNTLLIVGLVTMFGGVIYGALTEDFTYAPIGLALCIVWVIIKHIRRSRSSNKLDQ